MIATATACITRQVLTPQGHTMSVTRLHSLHIAAAGGLSCTLPHCNCGPANLLLGKYIIVCTLARLPAAAQPACYTLTCENCASPPSRPTGAGRPAALFPFLCSALAALLCHPSKPLSQSVNACHTWRQATAAAAVAAAKQSIRPCELEEGKFKHSCRVLVQTRDRKQGG